MCIPIQKIVCRNTLLQINGETVERGREERHPGTTTIPRSVETVGGGKLGKRQSGMLPQYAPVPGKRRLYPRLPFRARVHIYKLKRTEVL